MGIRSERTVNHTKARFAYSWADRSKPPPQSFPGKKPSFQIIESDDAVTIEFEHVTLTIRTK